MQGLRHQDGVKIATLPLVTKCSLVSRLYHFTHARQRGEADDVVAYLAAQAKGLGILKRKRRSPKDAFLADLTQHGNP
jgi:hypothetical protein